MRVPERTAVKRVAAFTDTYLPTVNGATYTVRTWRDTWRERGGRMDVVFPDAPGYDCGDREHPIRSVGFPFYDGFRVSLPGVPAAVKHASPEIVHAHTPFALGLSALYLARRIDAPLIASYHTPTAEYADYVADGVLSNVVERVAGSYEQWFLNRAEVVVVPSPPAERHLRAIGVTSPIEVVQNGVDTAFFAPVDRETVAAFRDRHDLPDGPLVGYTGRHGYEKELQTIPPAVAAADTDATLVFGGDGPAADDVRAAAEAADVDARFLGFLDREELPALYTALDAFLFPSPVETQGLVALEANACGTPVVGVDAGALRDTIRDGENGVCFPQDDTEAFAAAIDRVVADREAFREQCLARRDATSVERAVDTLQSVYELVT